MKKIHASECVNPIQMSLFLPFRNDTLVGLGDGRARSPRRSAASDRRPQRGRAQPLPVFTERARSTRLVDVSADFKQPCIALIAAAWGLGAAPFGFAAQLLLADESKRGPELFVFDNRGLRDLADFDEGPIRQFGPAITDRQLAL